MINIYDSANQLATDLQQIDEYKALEKAIKGIKDNPTSLALFKKMDELQSKIVSAQQAGKTLSDEEQKEYQKLSEEVQKDAGIVQLLQAEQGLYKTIDDVQKAITKPINDLYDGLRN
ncbi:YlbF family regulator [Lactobacillus sp. ESL0791]|uniref:YlbF family regulator n=1 Tax=Lactobacillus sp. ESL0791 TaxID=2983234 RepID=UPI0023F738E3|nr:YlbF family regulator [Lactobacillus sp. ESL0791]MDF7638502.1 YlbF family regulator [Lactobacillus sp. ESL0791]